MKMRTKKAGSSKKSKKKSGGADEDGGGGGAMEQRAANGKVPASGNFNELSFKSVTKTCAIASAGR